MAIQICRDRVEKTIEIDGTVFCYREARGIELQDLRAKYLKIRNGKTHFDQGGFTRALLCKYITGWENLQDVHGTDIPYSAEIAEGVFDAITGSVILDQLSSAIFGSPVEFGGDEDDDTNP